jgi:hypothetical protein
MNFEFDRDVRSMLPADPREWWTRHELAGAVSMPEISFTPGKAARPGEAGKAEQFKLVTVLNGVTLSVSPEEWMGRVEVTRLASMRKTAEVFGGLYGYGREGFRAQGPGFCRRRLPHFPEPCLPSHRTPAPLQDHAQERRRHVRVHERGHRGEGCQWVH